MTIWCGYVVGTSGLEEFSLKSTLTHNYSSSSIDLEYQKSKLCEVTHKVYWVY